MRSAERRKVNVLEMKCLRCLVGVSRTDRIGNEEVRRRAGIEKEQFNRVDQRVLRWFTHKENGGVPYGQKGVDDGSNWSVGTGQIEVRLDSWCEGGLEQQKEYDGGSATMSNGQEGMKSGGAYVNDLDSFVILAL